MSQELTSARRALSKVSTDLKQGQLISAATAVRDSARLFGRVPMMRNEQEEFTSMLASATSLLRYNGNIIQLFPLAIEYVPGKEDELGNLMNQLIEALQEDSTEQARLKHKAYQEAQLAKGQKELKDGRLEEGRHTLDQLADDYSTEGAVVTEIGELFIEAGMFDDAMRHLMLAARLLPNSARVLNRLGIVLRRLKNYDEAETYFNRAAAIEDNDPNLYFNMGRMYFEWNKWDMAVDYARKALALAPDFAEPAKLIAYIERKRSEG